MAQKSTFDLAKAAKAFEKSKNEYVECRRYQQIIIKNFLKRTFENEDGFKIKCSSGRKDYKGGIPEGGLTNWKWIELYKNGMYYFISLQPFDQDPNSGNYHVIYDRIGVFSCSVEEKDDKKIAAGMKLTNIALPIDSEETLEKLAGLLR